MIRLFMAYVLGGTSNKREGPLFAFLVAASWGSFVIWKVSQGVDMSAVVGLVTTAVVTSLGLFAGTSTYHHATKSPPDPGFLPEGGGLGDPEGHYAPEGEMPVSGPHSGSSEFTER